MFQKPNSQQNLGNLIGAKIVPIGKKTGNSNEIHPSVINIFLYFGLKYPKSEEKTNFCFTKLKILPEETI